MRIWQTPGAYFEGYLSRGSLLAGGRCYISPMRITIPLLVCLLAFGAGDLFSYWFYSHAVEIRVVMVPVGTTHAPLYHLVPKTI